MQQRCNSNLPVVTSFLFSLEVPSLSLLLADFLSLEFSLFFAVTRFRIDWIFRFDAKQPLCRRESSSLFSFLSPGYAVAVEYIKYILVGKLLTKRCVDRKKPRAAIFVLNFSPFKSRASFARFSRAWRMRVTNSPARKLVPATFTLAFSSIRNPTKCSYITGWCSSKMLRIIFRLIVSVKTFNEL